MCGDCAVYRPKARSAGTISAGYAPNVDIASSDLNGDSEDGEEAINDNVPEDIRANVDANGVYNTSRDQLQLTSDTLTVTAKKAHKNSKTHQTKRVGKPAPH